MYQNTSKYLPQEKCDRHAEKDELENEECVTAIKKIYIFLKMISYS